MDNNKKSWSWLWLSMVIIVLDQLSKYIMTHYFIYQKRYLVLPFLNLCVQYNAGSAFGFLGNAGGWQVFFLVGIAITVSIVIAQWMGKTPRRDWMVGLSLSLILGGALGNLIDRLQFSYVVDFLDFHIGRWHFATFNLADASITIGACFLVVRLLFIRDQ